MTDTQDRLRFRWNGRQLEYVASGWALTPGTSVGLGYKLVSTEWGRLSVTHQRHADGSQSTSGPAREYALRYEVAGVAQGDSKLQGQIQIMPGSFPAGSVGNVWRLPDAPKGSAQELGRPTGLHGECLFLGGSVALVGAAAGSLLLMGGQGLFDLRALFRRLVTEPTSFPTVLDNFKYATLLWSTGVETNFSAGTSAMYGRIWG